MPTKFNLNIDSRTSDDMSGDGVTQNTNIRSEDPNELIAVLQKLAGMTSSAPAHDNHEIGPTGAVVVKQVSAAPHPSMGECGNVMMEEQLDEELANAPKPKTMKDLMGIVNTDHTASIPNKITKAGHGDNPLVPADDEESLLESRLMNEWRSDKIQHYAEELNRTLANKAIVENLDSFVDGTREYAVRKSDGFIKVYPIIENRVMTQSPVYVVQEAFGRDMKHLVGDTGPGKGRGVSPELSRNNEFSPDKLADLDVPAAQRAGMKPAEHPEKPSRGTHGRGRPMPMTEQEESDSVRERWNKFARHVAISRDDSESTEIRSRARREAEDLYLDTAEEYGTHMAVDMKKYATHKLSYDQTGNRKHDEIATDLLARYAHDEPKSNMDNVVEPVDDESDDEIPAILRRQAGESVNEAKNKYAIGMAAAMKATGDKPPLKKSTITKAHEIADKIKEGSKKK